MSLKKLLLLATVICAGFGVGYGVVSHALPYGRNEYYGYFKNDYDAWGTNVWAADSTTTGCAASGGNALPTSIDTADELINFVSCKIKSNNADSVDKYSDRYGGSFIVLTMSGQTGTTIGDPATDARFQNWARDVRYAEKMSRITWNATYSYTTNTYFQGTGSGTNPYDDAWYSDAGSSSAITFKNASGTVVYAIRRQCGNPIGGASGPSQIPDSIWTMTGQVNATDTGGVNSKTSMFPNDTVRFTSQVKNAGPATAYYDWAVRYCFDTCPGGFASGYTAVPGGSATGQTQAASNAWVTKYTWDYTPGGSTAHNKICVWIYFTNATGYGTAASTSTPMTCVNIVTGSVGCAGSVTNPTRVDPADAYTLTMTLNTSGGIASAQSIVAGGGKISVTITNPNGGATLYSNANVSPTAGGDATTGTLTGSVSPGATNLAGNFLISYSVTGGGVVMSPCQDPFPVVYTPYFSIRGGDVVAGPGFGSACTVQTSDIKAKNLGDTKGYYGAGTELAAFQSGTNTDFATNTTLGAGVGGNSTGLSSLLPQSVLAFSNSATSSTVWGTGFGSTWCARDYYSSAYGDTQPPSVGPTLTQAILNGLTGDTYYSAGDLTISTLALGGANKTRVTIVVDGNVNITGTGITYTPYNYVSGTTNISSIPNFKLIVKGNIFIDRTVTTLTGFYAAQPDGTDTGGIYTCSSGNTYLTNTTGDTGTFASADSDYYNKCSTALTIYGSVAANYIRLNRTAGSWKSTPSVSNGPAEKIVYTPELWMGYQGATNPSAQPFDAITSLPPIF